MSDKLTLEALFHLQDRALKYNSENSAILRKRLAVVSDAVGLAYEALSSMRFEKHKQTAIRVLSADAFSSVVTSVRVGLWGNLPDSIALLRCAIETNAILAAVVEGQNYEAATSEMGTPRLRQFSFDDAVSQLGETGSKIRSLHGRLSNIGSHSTAPRLKFTSYDLNQQSVDRMGFALDPTAAENALSLAPIVCLHLLDSLAKSYSQDSIACPFAGRLQDLRKVWAEVETDS